MSESLRWPCAGGVTAIGGVRRSAARLRQPQTVRASAADRRKSGRKRAAVCAADDCHHHHRRGHTSPSVLTRAVHHFHVLQSHHLYARPSLLSLSLCPLPPCAAADLSPVCNGSIVECGSAHFCVRLAVLRVRYHQVTASPHAPFSLLLCAVSLAHILRLSCTRAARSASPLGCFMWRRASPCTRCFGCPA